MIEFMRAAGILVVVLVWILAIEGMEKRWKHVGSIVAVFLSFWAMEEVISTQVFGSTALAAYASEAIFLLVIPTLVTHYVLKKELPKAAIPSVFIAVIYYAKDYLPMFFS